MITTLLVRGARWAYEEAREKLSVRETWRELKALGRKHGPRFFVAALIWELIEDVAFPAVAWYFGYPALIPFFLVMHFEPIVYPVFFAAFRLYDRILGREPWDPDRLAASAYWRTGLKVLSHRILSILLFFAILGPQVLQTDFVVLAAYTVMMTLFAYVHDRLWHDSNFGIDVPTDTVQIQRILLKGLTYRMISVFVMALIFQGTLGSVPVSVYVYQALAFLLGLGLSYGWSRNTLGIRTIPTGAL